MTEILTSVNIFKAKRAFFILKRLIFATLAVSLLFSADGFAEPYTPFNQDSIFSTENADGGRSLSLNALFAGVDNVWRHAKQYPIRFDNREDAQRAYKDLQTLTFDFDFIRKQKLYNRLPQQEKLRFDLYEARIFVISHNFDVKGAAEKADAAYKKLLRKNPSAKLHTEYGIFLGNSGRIKQAQKHFKAAIKGGDTDAHYGLAMAYIGDGKVNEAAAEMQKYSDLNPQDKNAANLLEALKSGKLVIENKYERK